jgi:hypothetical protein
MVRSRNHPVEGVNVKELADFTVLRASPQPHPIDRPLSWPLCDIISLCAQNFVPAMELNQSSSDLTISRSRICGAWIEVLPALVGRGEAEYFNSAVKALGVSIAARGRDGRAPLSDALEAQCLALQLLREKIHTCSTSSFNEVAAATMCLFLSEVVSSPNLARIDAQADELFSRWCCRPPVSALQSHADGISRLIQLRRPEFYSSGIPHKLFVGFRPLLVRDILPCGIAYLTVQIVHAFATRRSTFLASLVWKDKPFCVIPPTPLQALFNDASEIPSILEELDGSKSRLTSEAVSVAWHAINRFDRVLNGLIRWYKETSAAYGDHLWWSKLQGEETHFWFPSIAVANSLTNFWAF